MMFVDTTVGIIFLVGPILYGLILAYEDWWRLSARRRVARAANESLEARNERQARIITRLGEENSDLKARLAQYEGPYR